MLSVSGKFGINYIDPGVDGFDGLLEPTQSLVSFKQTPILKTSQETALDPTNEPFHSILRGNIINSK